jgi:hypothetical protein
MQADTAQYEASHGRQPWGIGGWRFRVGDETLFLFGRYGDSKRKAFKIAQARGEEQVVVLPDKSLAPQGGNPERPENMTQDQIDSIKNRFMAQAETRTFQKGKRERLTIPVKGMKAAEVMVVFDIQSKRTAHAIVKRGFHILGYNERRQCPGTMDDVEEAYRIAKWWLYKRMGGRAAHGLDADDMIQEAVLRLVELAGDPKMKSESFKFYVVRSTMAEYLRRNRKHAHEDEEEIEAPGSRRGTWDRTNRATETMCRMIEAKGITPMARAA